MSASLVGSEMCIRDSSGAKAAPDPLWLSRASDAGACTSARAYPWPRKSCLLYTSDAADDM
eukprot:10013505-Alexandrium_andersonii.AAC.1